MYRRVQRSLHHGPENPHDLGYQEFGSMPLLYLCFPRCWIHTGSGHTGCAWFDAMQSEFQLWIYEVKTITWAHRPLIPPQTKKGVYVKQYQLPRGHKEIGQTILKLEEAGLIHPTQSPFNSLAWPMQKPDGMCSMTVDYQTLNKVTPLPQAVWPNIAEFMDCLTQHWVNTIMSWIWLMPFSPLLLHLTVKINMPSPGRAGS